MSDFRKRPWRSGKLVSSAVQELFEPVGFRRDTLGLPRDTKVFEGERVTVRAGQVYPTYFAALTGQGVTTAAGSLSVAPIEYQWFTDSFTDSNGTNITSHIETDTWVEIVASGGTGEPQIQSNRARNLSTSDNWVGYVNYPPYGEGAYQTLESVFYRRATSTGGGSNELTEAVLIRVEDYGGGIWDGYLFGWSEADDTWYLKRNNNYSGISDLASSTTNAFTGTSQSRTLKIIVSDPDSSTVNIKCYVDGTEVIDHDDTAAGRLANPIRGLGVYFWLSGSVDIDSINAVEQLNKLTGQAVTVNKGDVTAFWYPVPGAYLSPGHQITVTGGTLLPVIGDGANVELTGLSVTTDYGDLGVQVGAGAGTTAGALKPKLTASNSYNASPHPDHVTNQYVYRNGSWVAIAEYDKNAAVGTKYAVFETEDGRAGASFLSVYPDIGTSSRFPRASGPQSTQRYNWGYDAGGMFSADENGVRHSAHFRSLTPPDSTYAITSNTVPHYMAWRVEGLSYYGPELPLGYGSDTGEDIEQRGFSALGLYARSDISALAFKVHRLDPTLGVNVRLTGLRSTVTRGAITAAFDGLGTVQLVGQATEVRGGELGVDGVRALTGHQITTSAGMLVPVNSNDGLALTVAEAEYLDTAWTPVAVSAAVTGGGRIYPKRNVLCVVPTGYADTIYAVYINEPPESATPYVGVVVYNVATKTVVAHTNTATVGKVDSTDGAPSGYSLRQERSVAEVVRLSSGTSLTQFLIDKHVVHISWTSGTVNSPTVTVKSGPTVNGAAGSPPEQIVAGWEMLAHRGDSAYHVLFRYTSPSGEPAKGVESISKVYVNDATGTGSTWTLTPTTHSGGTAGPTGWSEYYVAPTDPDFYNKGVNVAGYTGDIAKLQAFRNYNRSGGTYGDDATVDVDFWDNTFPIFSQQISMRTGTVRVVITEYTPLTGHSLTVAPGTFTSIASGADRTVYLSGHRITTTSGICAPLRVSFVVDTFTEGSTVDITAHTSDTGTGWVRLGGTGDIQVAGGVARVTFDGGSATAVTVQSLAVSPSRDYKVTAHFGTPSFAFYNPDVPEFSIGVRCPSGSTNGYYFGYNRGDDKWYLVKRGGGVTEEILGSYSATTVTTDEYSIEVQGDWATRIICRKGPTTIIEYVDDRHDEGRFPHADGYQINLWGVVPDNEDSPYVLDINGSYYDPGALVLEGHRITVTQGQLTGPWLLGQRITLTQGVLTPTLVPPIEVALTGLSVTTALGTLYTNAAELTGESVTVTAGTLGIGEVYAGLTGQQLVVSAGMLALLNRELPGLRLTTMRGNVGVVVDAYPTLTGIELESGYGQLAPTVTAAFAGYGCVTAAGLLSATVGTVLAGARLSITAGVLQRTALNETTLTGQAVTVAQGDLEPVVTQASALDGEGVAVAEGSVVPTVMVELVGARTTATGGAFVPLCGVTLTGQAAVSTQGVLTLLTNVALTGQACTVSAGSVGENHGCTIAAVGVVVAFETGSVALPADTDTLLWLTQRSDDLVATRTDEDEYVVILPN